MRAIRRHGQKSPLERIREDSVWRRGHRESDRRRRRRGGRLPQCCDRRDRESGGQEEPGQPPGRGGTRGDPSLQRRRCSFGDRGQLQFDVARGLPAVLGILGQARLDQTVERGRAHRLNGGDNRRLARQDRRHDRDRARSPERLPPRRHLVEHRAQREDVAPRVALSALQLLRRHVRHRPQNHPRLRHVLRRGRGRSQALHRRDRNENFGQAEVEKLDSRLRDHRIGRLQVAVDDPLAVRRLEGRGDLGSEPQCLIEGQQPSGEAFCKGLPLEQFHHEVLDAVLIPDIVERADVRMRELRDRLGLPLEPLPHVGRGGQALREHFYRDGTLETGVPRPVDFSHPSGPDGRENFVGAEPGTGRERHPRSPITSEFPNQSPAGIHVRTTLRPRRR